MSVRPRWLFVSERKQIAMPADEKLYMRTLQTVFSHRLFATSRSEMEIDMNRKNTIGTIHTGGDGGMYAFWRRQTSVRRLFLYAFIVSVTMSGCQGKPQKTPGPETETAKETDDAGLKDLTINQVIDLSGYVDLGTYKGVKIKKIEAVPVSDREVEQEIDETLESHAVRREKKDKKIEKGDYVTLSFQGYRGKKKVQGAYCSELTTQIGSGTLIPDLEQGLLGKRPSEKAVLIKAKVPKEDSSAYAGKTLIYHVIISDIFMKDVPKLTADTAKQYFHCDTVDEVTGATRTKLEKARKEEAEDAMAQAAWKQAVANAVISEYPEKQLEEFKQQAQSTYEQEALGANLSLEDYMLSAYGINPEEYEEQLTEAAKELLASEMVYQAIIKKEKLSLTDEEYKEGVKSFVDGKNYTSVEEVEKQVDKTRLEQRILYRKAYQMVYENAKFLP